MEENLVLNLPLDEPAGSAVAYDYSKSRKDATVTDAEFVFGPFGNCLEFDAHGRAEVEHNILNLSNDFTMAGRIKQNSFPDGFTGKELHLVVAYSGVNSYSDWLLNIPKGEWVQIVLVKSGLALKLYINGILSQTYTLSAQPVGVSFVQDIYSGDYGYGNVDDFKLYNLALTPEQINSVVTAETTLNYWIDGKNFKDWGVFVSESDGILDRPPLKAPFRVDWPDYHGEAIDLSRKRVEVREISLQCFMQASGKLDFANKLNSFLVQFDKDGTNRLMIELSPTKPLVFEVYNETGVVTRKRWRDDLMVGTFTLNLREPDPVKRVIMHQRFDGGTATLTITLTTTKMLTVYWGDGSQTDGVIGTVTLNHTYASNGRYYAIVAGVLDAITSFTTNGVVVWSKL